MNTVSNVVILENAMHYSFMLNEYMLDKLQYVNI